MRVLGQHAKRYPRTFANKWKFEQMEILRFFLQFIREQTDISVISCQMRLFFHSSVAIYSRTNGNLVKNACSRNENGIPFVREHTVGAERPGAGHCIGRDLSLKGGIARTPA